MRDQDTMGGGPEAGDRAVDPGPPAPAGSPEAGADPAATGRRAAWPGLLASGLRGLTAQIDDFCIEAGRRDRLGPSATLDLAIPPTWDAEALAGEGRREADDAPELASSRDLRRAANDPSRAVHAWGDFLDHTRPATRKPAVGGEGAG